MNNLNNLLTRIQLHLQVVFSKKTLPVLYKYLIATLILIVFSRCNSTPINIESPDTKIFTADFKSTADAIDTLLLSTMYDKFEYIQLETHDDLLIGEIRDIKIVKNKIYVQAFADNKIGVFNLNGEFINKLDHRGHGPGEYLACNSFDVDPRNGNISVLDVANHKIFVYDSLCNYIGNTSYNKNDYPRDVAILDNGDYLLYGPDINFDGRRGLWQISDNGEFKKQLISIDENFRLDGIFTKYFQRMNDSTISLMGMEDYNRIYHITKDTITTPYKIDIRPQMSEKIIRISQPTVDEKKNGNFYIKHSYLENDDWVRISIQNSEDEAITLYYDKNTQELTTCKNNTILKNDIKIISSTPSFQTNKYHISYFNYYNIYQDEECISMFPELTEDANPIIVLLHTKNNTQNENN